MPITAAIGIQSGQNCAIAMLTATTKPVNERSVATERPSTSATGRVALSATTVATAAAKPRPSALPRTRWSWPG